MEKKDNKQKDSIFSSFGRMFKRLFSFGGKTKELNVFEEEEIKSPTKVIMTNFIHNKYTIIGLILFIGIFSFSYIGGAFKKLDPIYNEPILQNIGPGTGYLDVPSELQGKNIVQISSGITFSVGLSDDGKLYTWGKDIDGATEIPTSIGTNIVKVAAGDRHVVALTDNGELIGWGKNDFHQAEIGYDVKALMQTGEKFVEISANDKYTAALTDLGNLYILGAKNANGMDFVPAEIQGKIANMDANSYNMAILLKDGTIATMGVTGNEFSNVPKELTDGSVNVVKVKMSYANGVALDDQGKVHVWGANGHNLMKGMPEVSEKIVDVAAARNTLYMVGESGKVYAWGDNDLNELAVPSDTTHIKQVFANYFQAYAVDEDNQVHSWGNNGYVLGTDAQGRDYLTRLMHGGRVTLVVGVIAVIIQTILGLLIGMISGFKGGRIDNLLMRFTEIVSSVPFMPLVITLSASIGNGLSTDQKMYLIMIILGVISWPGIARLVRAQILIEREKDFVLAARALGIKERSIIVRHILPNVLNICIVNMTLSYADKMLMEAALSFLGFGVQEPLPSWGNMLNGAQRATVIENYWWQWITPAVCVVVAALGVNLIGDALREALDPKENEK